jgi:folate-dependent phosphoribosylglycinamide formyltransferase PurN
VRVAILTFESPQGNLITQSLLRRRSSTVCGILQAVTVEPSQPGWRSILRISRRAAPDYLLWKVAERAVSQLAWWWQRVRRRRAVIPTLADLAAEFGVPLVTTRDVNGERELDVLRRWRPDLGISVHFPQRIGRSALAAPPLGMVNVHGALLPSNRGLFPYFWELANGDPCAGVTVHWIDERLDTGDILVQRRVPIDVTETVSSLSWKGAELGAALLDEAIDSVAAGTPPRVRQTSEAATYFSWPTRADVLRLRGQRRRLGTLADPWRMITWGARYGAR